MDEFDEENISDEILKKAEKAELCLIPAKSEGAYVKEYKRYVDWKDAKKQNSSCEKILLAYFHDLVCVYYIRFKYIFLNVCVTYSIYLCIVSGVRTFNVVVHVFKIEMY